MIRNVSALALILFGTLYIFVAFAQLPTLILALQGAIPPSQTILLFMQAPFLMLRFGDTLPTLLFFLSAILSGIYMFLFFLRIARAKAVHLRYGLPGSLVSLLSIGCVACGSLLSPLMILAGVGIPPSYLSRFDLMLGIIGNVLLALGIALFIKMHHGVS